MWGVTIGLKCTFLIKSRWWKGTKKFRISWHFFASADATLKFVRVGQKRTRRSSNVSLSVNSFSCFSFSWRKKGWSRQPISFEGKYFFQPQCESLSGRSDCNPFHGPTYVGLQATPKRQRKGKICIQDGKTKGKEGNKIRHSLCRRVGDTSWSSAWVLPSRNIQHYTGRPSKQSVSRLWKSGANLHLQS